MIGIYNAANVGINLIYRNKKTMNTQALDEIIARMIPILPGDCKRSKSKKEWMRQEARERLIAWALAAGAIYYRLRIDPQPQTGGTVSGPILAVVGTDNPDRKEEIVPVDKFKKGILQGPFIMNDHRPDDRLVLLSIDQIAQMFNSNTINDDPGTTT